MAGNDKEADPKRARMLLIAFVAMLVVGVGNRVFSVLSGNALANYALFQNMATTFAYIPTSLLWIVPVYMRGGRKALEETNVPQVAWLVMGLLDSLASVLQALAIAHLSSEGGLVVLLLQSAIPASMVISYFSPLKARYKPLQYIGAVIVVAGLAVVLGPQLGGGSDSGIPIWSAVLIASCIPMTLSSVYKEMKLGDAEIDPVWFNFAVAVYQFAWAFPLLVPLGYTESLTPSQLWPNVRDGMKCLVGTNSQASDDCSMAGIYFGVYIFFNLLYNVLIVVILKVGSSNLLWLSLVAGVPIANAAFALPFMPDYKPITWSTGVGLPVIMAGLVAYRFHAPMRAWLQARGIYPADKAADEGEVLLTSVAADRDAEDDYAVMEDKQ